MSARTARFEVCQSDAGWFARFRAANGRIVWVTEMYGRRGKALHAITLIAKPMSHTPWPVAVMVQQHGAVEVRDVDERTEAPS